MEEAKAAAYYDELTRKGEGAAKFKQGLGFSSSSSSDLKKAPAFSLSSFVRASSPSGGQKDGGGDRGADDRTRVLGSIHDKLSGGRLRSPSYDGEKRRDRDEDRHSSRKSRDIERDRHRDRRSHQRSRSRSYSPRRVSNGRDRDRYRDKDRGGARDRDGDGDRARDRDRERERERDRDRRERDGRREKEDHNLTEKKSGGRSERALDYSQLIDGYSQMTPAERVKAKMKLQLSQTAAKDTAMGMNCGWERFDFNKEAPLDDDVDETEVAEDDATVVKEIGRSFRFSAVEARREEEVKAAHDLAMFGVPTSSRANHTTERTGSPKEGDEDGSDIEAINDENQGNNAGLLSEKVLTMQQGSWRDRARRLQNGSGKG